jgi:peptidoglycan hydrolase-like protein with peptidoglycan-binding domain
MKPIADSRAFLTSKRKNTNDVICVSKSWEKLSSIARVGLLSFGITLALFNTIATEALALEIVTTEITKAETKQSKSDPQYPTLSRNSNRSQEVKYLQRRLRELGYYKQTVNGIFGPVTEDAVKRFQVNADIFPSGIVNTQTWNAIEKRPNTSSPKVSQSCNRPTLQLDSQGKDVRELQQRLYDLGYLKNSASGKFRPSGKFGEPTKNAVMRFQRRQELPETGIVNAPTWEALKLSCKFVVVVTVTSQFTLNYISRYVPGAFIFETEAGLYINAGEFPSQQEAKKLVDFLRDKEFDARLVRKTNIQR